MLKFGDPIQLRLWRKLQRRGDPSPLDDRPELDPEGLHFWEGFNQLHSSRLVGMGAQPLQISEIDAWAKMYGLTRSERREFLYVIKALDDVWLAKARENATQATH